MGRACDCCGSEDCVTTKNFFGFSIDRYKPTYYSITETTTEEGIEIFLASDSDPPSATGAPLIRDVTSSKEIERGSLKLVENYNYFAETDSGDFEAVSADSLIEQYPSLEGFLDLTNGNQFMKRSIKRISVQTRTLLEFDCSDIFDLSDDLVLRSFLKLSSANSDLLNFIRRTQELPEFKSWGVDFLTSEPRDELDSRAIKVHGIFDLNQSLIPKNFEQWDDLVSTAPFSTEAISRYKQDSVDVTGAGTSNSSRVSFLISPYESSFLDSNYPSSDTKVYGYRTLLDRSATRADTFTCLEIIRPPFGPDLEDEQNYIDRVLQIIETNYNGFYDWHDDWERVDDMFTFVSKGSFLNRATDIVRSGLYGVTGLNAIGDWRYDLQFSVKIYKPSSGNKKSQIEKVYFDGLFYWEEFESYKEFKLPIINMGESTGCSPEIVESNDDSVIGSSTIQENFVTKDVPGGTLTDCQNYNDRFFTNQIRWYGPFDIPYEVHEKELERYRVAFINNVDNSYYLTNFDPFIFSERGNDDIISVTSDYVQAFSHTNWDKAEDFLYYGRTVDFNTGKAIPLIADVRSHKKYDLLKNYDEANLPELVEIYGKTFFRQEIDSAKIKVSFKNTRGKFPNSDIRTYTLGPECRNQCLATDTPLQWEIKDQKFSYPLLPTILKVEDSDLAGVRIQKDGFTAIVPTLICHTTFYSKKSLFEIHGDLDKFSSKSAAVYKHSEDGVVYNVQGFTGSPCQPDLSLNRFITGSHEVKAGSGRVSSGYDSRGAFQSRGGQVVYRDGCKDPNTFNIFIKNLDLLGPASVIKRSPLKDLSYTAAAQYMKRKSKKPVKIVKDAGWSKKIQVEDITVWPVNDASFLDTRFVYSLKGYITIDKIASGEETDIYLGKVDSFTGNDEILGDGIRYRRMTRPTYGSLNGQKPEYLPDNELGKDWIPICQYRLGRYRQRRLEGTGTNDIPLTFTGLTKSEIAEIFRLTMGNFDYWYQVVGRIFIEDPAGDTEVKNTPGYFIENPYFKIDTSGKNLGPYTSHAMQKCVDEVAVTVKTSIEVPDIGSPYRPDRYSPSTFSFTLDLDYDPEDPESIFGDYDELGYVYGFGGHAKTQETDPFGVGGDPEFSQSFEELAEKQDLEYSYDCLPPSASPSQKVDSCATIRRNGWGELPELTAEPFTFDTPDATAGCTENPLAGRCPEDPPTRSMFYNTYGIDKDRNPIVFETGTVSKAATFPFGGDNSIRFCPAHTFELIAHSVTPQGDEAKRIYERTKIFSDAIVSTITHVLTPELQNVGMRHKRIVSPSDLNSSLEISFDHEDGVYWRIDPQVLTVFDSQGYYAADIDNAVITGTKGSAGNTERPFEVPLDYPITYPLFCNEEIRQRFSEGANFDDCGKSTATCDEVSDYFTIDVNNGFYGAPGDPLYEYMLEQTSDEKKNFFGFVGVGQYSPDDFGQFARPPWRLWMHDTNLDDEVIHDRVGCFGFLTNTTSNIVRRFEEVLDDEDSAFQPLDTCVGHPAKRDRCFDCGTVNNYYIVARVGYNISDVYKDYTFTVGVS